MKFDDIKLYAIALFGIVVGQILHIGQKTEKGQPVSWPDLLVMSMLPPAYGALVAAAGGHCGWSVPMTLAASICAGWLGFVATRTVLALVRGRFPKTD